MANNLSSESDRYIREAVASGMYESEEQAIEQAVVLLRKRDSLRADVAAGVKQADAGELIPAEFVFERLEARARQIVADATTQE